MPTLANLRSKRVADGTVCRRCRSGEEDVSYVFRFCPAAMEIWQMLDLSWVNNSMIQSFWDWLTWIFKRSTYKQCRVFCCGMWFFWGSRNKLMHERKIELGRELSMKVLSIQQKRFQIDGGSGGLGSDGSTPKTENSLAHRIAKEALRREEETHLEGEALHCLQMSPEGKWRRFPN
ncbi:hypothetical protein Golax_015050 [Gossypium laxum]|uniref:Reverse transcriptase zinc-binding domain-containing protein n=1 Tax=Gossypium laxum TaxID=34288 RepID=A0A7J8ZY30_9ROSI|nr:hypothetical protein [Gossypium laxum]